jgi:uncharacterized protein (DUF58 family)
MMDAVSREARLTPLLANNTLNRLERLRVKSIRRFTDKHRGEHLSGRGGTSNEFSDYRDYAPGDDVRFVDWNIFARLNRPYMKLFHLEEEMHLAILVDGSNSMMFERKLDRAKELAAAFGVMGLMGTERVSVTAFAGEGPGLERLGACVGRASMMKLFRFVEGIEGGGASPLEEGIDEFLKYHVGRGVAVILSDFLTFGDVRRALNSIFGRGLEIFAVQILGPTEVEPEVSGDVRFVDSETQAVLDVSPAELVALYQDCREDFERELALMCQQRSGRFVSVSSEDPLDWVLFDLLVRKGWIA